MVDSLVSWVTEKLTDRPQFVCLGAPLSDVVVSNVGLQQGLFCLHSCSPSTPHTFSTTPCTPANIVWLFCSSWVYKWWMRRGIQSTGEWFCRAVWEKPSASECGHDQGVKTVTVRVCTPVWAHAHCQLTVNWNCLFKSQQKQCAGWRWQGVLTPIWPGKPKKYKEPGSRWSEVRVWTVKSMSLHWVKVEGRKSKQQVFMQDRKVGWNNYRLKGNSPQQQKNLILSETTLAAMSCTVFMVHICFVLFQILLTCLCTFSFLVICQTIFFYPNLLAINIAVNVDCIILQL